MKRWWPLVALAIAQFVMVLDQSVMNVSISHAGAEFDTTVTTIQAVITLYCLVMAMFMLTVPSSETSSGVDRRSSSASSSTAPARRRRRRRSRCRCWPLAGPSRRTRCAMVLPGHGGADRRELRGRRAQVAYAVPGGGAGAGIAVGPILGGWATTELTWRIVFVGEVVIVAVILAMSPLLRDAPARRAASSGSTTWAPSSPRSGSATSCSGSCSPPPGVGAPQGLPVGAVRLLAHPLRHRRWCRAAVGLRPVAAPPGGRRGRSARPPRPAEDPAAALRAGRAVHPEPRPHGRLLRRPPLPPARPRPRRPPDRYQAAPHLASRCSWPPPLGSRLSTRFSVRTDRAGRPHVTAVVAVLALLTTVQPTLADAGFAISMGLLGVGMGLIVSQLGNVVQSSVDVSGPRRGRRAPVHRPAARLLTRRCPDRGDRAGRPDQQPSSPGSRPTQRISAVPSHRRSASADGTGRRLRHHGPDRRRRPGGRARRGTTSGRSSRTTRTPSWQALKAGLLAAGFLTLVSLAFTKDLPSELVKAPAEVTAGEPPT